VGRMLSVKVGGAYSYHCFKGLGMIIFRSYILSDAVSFNKPQIYINPYEF
jgi:hypothetical protein